MQTFTHPLLFQDVAKGSQGKKNEDNQSWLSSFKWRHAWGNSVILLISWIKVIVWIFPGSQSFLCPFVPIRVHLCPFVSILGPFWSIMNQYFASFFQIMTKPIVKQLFKFSPSARLFKRFFRGGKISIIGENYNLKE